MIVILNHFFQNFIEDNFQRFYNHFDINKTIYFTILHCVHRFLAYSKGFYAATSLSNLKNSMTNYQILDFIFLYSKRLNKLSEPKKEFFQLPFRKLKFQMTNSQYTDYILHCIKFQGPCTPEYPRIVFLIS